MRARALALALLTVACGGGEGASPGVAAAPGAPETDIWLARLGCGTDDSTAVLYVLGEPTTLQVVHVGFAGAGTVAIDVGRGIQRISGTAAACCCRPTEEGCSRSVPGRGRPEKR